MENVLIEIVSNAFIGFSMFKELFMNVLYLIAISTVIVVVMFRYKAYKENVGRVPLKVFIDGAFDRAKEYKNIKENSQQNMQ